VKLVAAVFTGPCAQTTDPSAGSVATRTRYSLAPGTGDQESLKASMGYVSVAPWAGLRSAGRPVHAIWNVRVCDQAPSSPPAVTPRTRQ